MATKKTAPAKKSAPSKEERPTRKSTAERRSSENGRPARRKSPSPGDIAKLAAQQLLELTGQAAEGVTALERTDDGWRVEIEVVETRRIPDTTDRLAVYEVAVDDRGDLIGYSRTRRYVRGRDDGESR